MPCPATVPAEELPPIDDFEEGQGVDQLKEALGMLAESRRKHDEATKALEHILTSLTSLGGTEECTHGLPSHTLGNTPSTPGKVASRQADVVQGMSVSMGPASWAVPSQRNEDFVRPTESAEDRWIHSILRATRDFDLPGWAGNSRFGWLSWISGHAAFIVSKRRFEFFMGSVIFLNSVCIGVETQQLLSGEASPVIEFLEHVFLVIYTLELILRLLARGRECFWDGWFLFDFSLVVTGATVTWILQPIQAAVEGASDSGGGAVSQLMVLRTCRLLRMLRALRLMKQFRSIWKLVYGLLASFNTMISTLSLVALVLYIFACLGVELITKDEVLNDPQYPILNNIVDENFKDLFVTTLFLFQFVIQDSVAAVYKPLIKAKPILALYFLMILLVVSISLMNLVMATIVEGAIDAARKDDEMRREQKKETIRATIPTLMKLFHELDFDGSGNVDLEELEALNPSRLPEELANLVGMHSMLELFYILDVDQSGEVSQDEFIEGLLQLHVSDVPPHVIQILQLLRTLRDKITVIEKTSVA